MVLHYTVGKVLSNGKMKVCHRTDRLPDNLDTSSNLSLLSLPLAFQSPLKLEGTFEEASMEHCLCTTRPQGSPAASHSLCVLKLYHCHPLLWNFLPFYFDPF